MPAEIDAAMVANTAAWWDTERKHVHDGLMTPQQAWDTGVLDWPILIIPVEYPAGVETGVNLIVRGDNDEVFSHCSDWYTPVQNKRFLEYLCELADTGELLFESILSLRGGRCVALCARRPEGITVAGEEHVQYLTGANWHDRTRLGAIFFSNVRTVCANTLNAGLSSAKNVFRFRHVGDIDSKLQNVRETLQMGFKYTEEVAEIGEKLALKPMGRREFETFLKAAAPTPERKRFETKADYVTAAKSVIKTRDGIREVYRDTDDLNNLRGTEWGALQSVLAYNDHVKRFTSPERRFEGIVLTQNETAQRAFDYLVAS